MSSNRRRRSISAVLFAVPVVLAFGLVPTFGAATAAEPTPTVPVTSVVPDTTGTQPDVENTEDVNKDEPAPPVESTNEGSPETTVDDTQNDDTSTQAPKPAPSQSNKTEQGTNQVSELVKDEIAAVPNQDGDAYDDDKDACDSTPPEDIANNNVDENGCGNYPSPDQDTNDDNDGRPYHDDNCPFENATGKDVDEDGCIDEEDTDRDDDGLLNNEEDVNDNGQVDPGETDPDNSDTDGDGVGDGDDKCATVSGTGSDGCPIVTPPVDTDTDGDGTPDDQDQCPNVAGPAENNGCPVTPPEVTKTVTWKLPAGKTPSDSFAEQFPQTVPATGEPKEGSCGGAWYQKDVYKYTTEKQKATVNGLDDDGKLTLSGSTPEDSEVYLSHTYVEEKTNPSECGENPPSSDDQPVVVELDGDCDQVNPMFKVTTPFESSIGYKSEGSDQVVFLRKEVKTGEYILTLPAVKRGTSFTYSIVVVPMDDAAKEKVFGPNTFNSPEKCDVPNSPPSSNPNPPKSWPTNTTAAPNYVTPTGVPSTGEVVQDSGADFPWGAVLLGLLAGVVLTVGRKFAFKP